MDARRKRKQKKIWRSKYKELYEGHKSEHWQQEILERRREDLQILQSICESSQAEDRVPDPPPGKQLELAAQEPPPVLQEPPPRITSENVDRIRPGMALADVCAILGDPNVVRRQDWVERCSGNGVRRTTATLDWQEGTRRVTVTFEDDKVLEVHQRGLE
jgi:hypothetical protein